MVFEVLILVGKFDFEEDITFFGLFLLYFVKRNVFNLKDELANRTINPLVVSPGRG